MTVQECIRVGSWLVGPAGTRATGHVPGELGRWELFHLAMRVRSLVFYLSRVVTAVLTELRFNSDGEIAGA